MKGHKEYKDCMERIKMSAEAKGRILDSMRRADGARKPHRIGRILPFAAACAALLVTFVVLYSYIPAFVGTAPSDEPPEDSAYLAEPPTGEISTDQETPTPESSLEPTATLLPTSAQPECYVGLHEADMSLLVTVDKETVFSPDYWYARYTDPFLLTGCSFDETGDGDDSVFVMPYLNDEGSVRMTKVDVILGDGTTLTATYDENYSHRLWPLDLLSDGTEQLVLERTSVTSTYAATDVHVLKVVGDRLVEILTVLDNDENSYNAELYKDTLFVILAPDDYCGMTWDLDVPERVTCSGVTPISRQSGNGTPYTGLKFESHRVTYNGMLGDRLVWYYYKPFHIVRWNGDRWEVVEQGYEQPYGLVTDTD